MESMLTLRASSSAHALAEAIGSVGSRCDCIEGDLMQGKVCLKFAQEPQAAWQDLKFKFARRAIRFDVKSARQRYQ